jgi:hypothetical protein
MAKVDLRKTVYNKDQFSRVVGGREFTTFGIQDATPFSVEDFFQQYDALFLTIPVFGEVNTHEYLVRRSSELVGFQRTTEDLQPLLDEITNLREQLLAARQENINLQVQSAGGDIASQLNDQFTELLAALGEQPEINVNIEGLGGDGQGGAGTGEFTLVEDIINAIIPATGAPKGIQVAVFENDQIPEGKALTFKGISTKPQYGTAVVLNTQNGTIEYTPNADAPTGPNADRISYIVVDEEGIENTGFIRINIENIARDNQPPVANDDIINVSVDVDGTINSNTINVLINDIDPDSDEPLFFDGIVTQPTQGTLNILDPETGIVEYIPNKRAKNGDKADQFEYKVIDNKGLSAIGKVFVNIRNRYITFTSAGDDELSITIRVTDRDSPNSNKTFENNTLNVLENDNGLDIIFDGITSQPEYGTLTATADGVVTYIPKIGVRSSGEIDLNAWFTPGAGVEPIVEDSFTYRAKNNASGTTDIATVNVRINVLLPDEQPILGDRTDPLGSGKKASDDDTDASGRPQESDFRNEEEKDKKKSGGGAGRETKTYNSSADANSTTGPSIFN